MTDLTVIFDMDGVILDSERVYQEIERQMYSELGIPVSPEEHLGFMGTAETFMWNKLREKYGLGQELNFLISEERKRFLSRLETPGAIPLMDGLLPLLKSLSDQKIPLWIASSSSREIIEKVLAIYRLNEFFQGSVSGEEVIHSKPSPEIFLKAAALASTHPSRCLVIEDSINGVQAGKSANMTVVALRNPGSEDLDLSGADRVVNSLAELGPDIIRTITDPRKAV